MRQKLAAFVAGEQGAHFSSVPDDGGRPDVVFLFTGDDGDCVNAGRTLFESAPGFRAILEQCDARLRPYLDRPLLSVLYPEASASLPLDDSYARPALFSIAYAPAELWRSVGHGPRLGRGPRHGRNRSRDGGRHDESRRGPHTRDTARQRIRAATFARELQDAGHRALLDAIA